MESTACVLPLCKSGRWRSSLKKYYPSGNRPFEPCSPDARLVQDLFSMSVCICVFRSGPALSSPFGSPLLRRLGE